MPCKIFNLHAQRKRILAVLVLISFLFTVLVVRLSIVQIIDGNWLQTKAMDQWTRGLPLTAERGKIYDTTGSALAVSYTTYNIYSRAREVENPAQVASYLSNLLDLEYDSVYAKVCNKNVSECLLKLQVEKNIAQQIVGKNLAGIFLSENVKRYYPYGNLLTQILGFTSIDNQGQAGIEAYYDKLLKGVNGEALVQSDIQGKKLDNTLDYYIPAIAGANITLTVDSKIQLAVEQTLETLMQEQKAKAVTCIIMNPKTGEIIAMSSKPSFDLNNVPRNNVYMLMETVKNKAVIDVYEPGSTFKILTMSAALEEGKAETSNTFYCAGSRVIDGEKIKCWKTIGHGTQTLTEGICNSCNCVFMDLSARLGIDSFYNYFNLFGLGQKSGIDIMSESAGILMPKDNVRRVDLVRMGFGQAIAVTPLQLLNAVCSCVNGGYLMQPYVVSKIESCDGKTIVNNQPTLIRQTISRQTSSTINSMLEQVVNKTAKLSFVPGYCIGGKTGTAQKYENGVIARGKYISSFIGTYPANNPEYAMLLLVDEPGAGAYYGSVVASPYAKQIFSKIFEYKNIEPINLQKESKKVVKNIDMPYLVGMSLANACAELAKLELYVEIEGEGGIVVAQLPSAGVKMFTDENVVLVT